MTNTYTLTLHIEKPGTDYTNIKNGATSTSTAGHVWMEATNPAGETAQAGFAPIEPKETLLPVQGEVKKNDAASYAGDPYYSETIQLTKAQYDAFMAFRKNPEQYGFSQTYWAGSNSCVDFVFKFLSVIGMNPTGTDGALLPMDNVALFQGLRNPQIAGGGLVSETIGSDTRIDNNGDGKIDNVVINGQGYDLHNVQDAGRVEGFWNSLGRVASDFWNSVTSSISSFLGGVSSAFNSVVNFFSPSSLSLDPIGAFYEVKSAGLDNSVSIANKTGVLLNAQKQGVSANTLAALDANKDGKLTGTELSALQMWFDTNQNGIQDAGEVQSLAQAGINQIRSADYSFYTSGNAVATTGPLLTPVAAAMAALPTSINLIQAAPASNFRTLRDTDNRYYVAGGGWIDFGANQVKINNSNRTYLIGTDGNDSFDANYYAAYGAYFNNNLLVNFLAGGGDDVMGGSVRNDNLWGGTGNDTLFGYAGDDKLYGEEGNDELQGGVGNDYLDGGVGNDKLFGQVGDDILVGGDGDDLLMGFTASNDDKQTLAVGETDNDFLYGGNGNDQLSGALGNDYLDGGADNDLIFGGLGDDVAFGGTGNDELHGNEGNDKLSGDAGDDKIFGEVGNDTIWGGDGNDILLGFTASNDAKQTLAAGETDNDTIYGGAGNDQMYGGLGNDYLDGGDGNDLVDGGEGTDTLFGGTGDDELNGGAGNDTLSGDAGADKIFGGVGNDQIWGGDGNDILVGFTPSNDAKQSLAAGETDDDIIDGGAGDDLILGGLGNDQLFGGLGNDELQGGIGDDQLSGNDGNDRLFGGAGNDIIYGGAGDDLIVGGVASNEAALAAGVSDNNWLYGGDGNDTILGGVGNDYIDGGAGADNMQGGTGDDTYIVNSVNDVILEYANQGYDTVISSSNYILNANIEELRLVEGFNINGTGNSLNNRIIGNSSDNILDGVTGADTMIGGLGNDTYYVDNVGDQVVEYAGEGVDTVQSKISYTLSDNVENLNLLDFSKPEKGLVDGANVLVYGYPKANELDYMQGDAVAGYKGTCALTSIANLMTQANTPTTEAQVVNLAIQNNWAVTSSTATDYQRGGSNYIGQQAILNSYGIANTLLAGYNPEAIANLIQSGRGVILGLNAGKLWSDANYTDTGGVNHVVTITGAVRNASTGALMGFYIADSGRQLVSDMTRYVSLADFQTAANVANAYAIYTTQALKLWNEDINGTGNALDNILIGNRGNNLLTGGAGNDTLTGGQGSDTLDGGTGNDTYQFYLGDGRDIITDSQGNDTLIFGAGIKASDIAVSRSGSSLTLTLNSQDSLRIDGMNGNGANAIDRVQFADGAIWNARSDGSGFNASVSGAVQMNGTVQQGQTLTLTNTLADADGLGTLNYQWQSSADGNTWTNLVGATGISYTLSQSDVSKRLRASVSYVDGRGNSENVISAITVPVANINDAPTGLVTVTGTVTQGQTLTASHTLADADGLGVITYQWQSSSDGNVWTNIDGATAASYTLTQSDVNRKIQAVASYTDGFGTKESVGSVATALVVPPPVAGAIRTGTAGNDNLYGTAGNDTLYGLAGDDWIDGAAGADIMIGGDGSDRYVVDNVGDQVIETATGGFDYAYSSLANYTLADNVEALVLKGNSAINGTGNSLDNFLYGNGANNILNGGAGNDYLCGYAGADTMIGGSGSDQYVVDNVGDQVIEDANAGYDLVQSCVSYTLSDNVEMLMLYGNGAINGTGNALSNSIYGNDFNNILFGAAGMDTLMGGLGNDTYLMQRGQGNDTIVDTDTTIGNNDIISLASDITSDQLWFSRVGTNLKISVIGTSDCYTVSNWYLGTANQVESIKAANGKVLSNTNVEKLVQAMSGLSAPVAGTMNLPTNYQTALNPVIAANWQ